MSTFKSRYLIEESGNYGLLSEMANEVKVQVNPKNLEKYVPQKYKKLFLNYLENESRPTRSVGEFYQYLGRNVPYIWDYIPMGYNNANYLALHLPSKKLYGLAHDIKYSSNIPGTNPKGDYESWAEHLTQGICHKNIKDVYKSKKDLEKDLSSYLGFKVEVEDYDWDDNYECMNFLPSKDDILFDEFGGKKLQSSIKKFEIKIKEQVQNVKSKNK